MELIFTEKGCCGGHITAEVTHANGLRSTVTDRGDGVFDVLTLREWTPIAPQEMGLSRAEVDVELERVALLVS